MSNTDWEQLKPNFVQTINGSSTNIRIKTLKTIQSLVSSNSIPQDDINGVVSRLLKTFNYYQDVNSRNEVLATLEAFIASDQHFLFVFVKFVHHQANQPTMAITDYLTLLAWINSFSVHMSKIEGTSTELTEINNLVVSSQATLLSHCVESSHSKSRHPDQHRRRIYESIISTTISSLVNTLSSRTDLFFDSFGSLLKSASNTEILTFLGCVDLSLNALTPTTPSVSPAFVSQFKGPILDFFINTVLLSKLPPTTYSMDIFGSFVNDFITAQDLSEIVPSIEKAILRSSENSFTIILPPFFKNLSSEISLDEILVSSKLLASILSGLKSTKEHVRIGAFNTMEAVLSHFDQANQKNVELYVNEIFKTLKSTSSADIKALLINSLSLLYKHDVASDVVTGLLPLVSKDQNEVSLASMLKVFTTYFLQLLSANSQSDIVKKSVAQFKAGLSDKKLLLRKIWSVELAESLETVDSDSVSTFLNELRPTLIKTLDEAQQSPLPTIANKGMASAYVTIALSKDADSSLFINSLSSNGERPAILTDPRVYTKLSQYSEFKWALKALEASVSFVPELDETAKLNYASAWIYLISSKNVPYELRLLALDLLKSVFVTYGTLLSPLVIKGIYKILTDYDSHGEDQVVGYIFKQFAPLLSLLTQVPSDIQLIKENLSQVLVIANHDLISIKSGWVGLAQRSGHNIDAGVLIEQNHSQIIDFIFELLHCSNTRSLLFRASQKAIGILAFIQPELIGPIVAATIASDINTENFENEDSKSLEIWRGTEGELVIDVLNQAASTKAEDKNSKDYEIKKWEESLKKELKNKSKPTKKLTKEELTLINHQIAKESEIRREIQNSINSVNRSIAIINELADNATLVENGVKYWYPAAINSILGLAKSSILTELFTDVPLETFLNLSKLVSPRLGLLRKFIGVSTIRVHNIQGLAENYLEEPLLNLIGRILFRIKILADQNPLDSISLSYILPLLTKVLENGKQVAIKNSSKQAVTSEFVEEDPEEEQLLLSIEIISAHAEAFEDDSIPRTNILEVLISLMKLPSKAKLSKECLLSMCQHIAVSLTKKDLKILLDNIITPVLFVRTAILEGIDSEFDLVGEIDYSNELLIAAHDNDTNSAEIALTIWEDNNLKVVPDAPSQLLKLAGNPDSGLRLSIAKAIVFSVKNLQEQGDANVFENTLSELIDLYNVKKNPPPAILDKFGLVVKSSTEQRDTWEERSTIALTLKLLGPLFTNSSIEKMFRFLVDGEALGDKEDLVRQELQEAGVEVINLHGFENVETLIPIFEANLAAKDQHSRIQDNIKECVIILYGALARHLESSDSRLEIIVERLIKTLDTPSEDVQFAVSECIAPLVSSFESKLPEYFDLLLDKLYDGKKFASRRGAAYGISGLVKGAGIKSLSKYDIIRNLTDASDDKKDPNRREGVSFAFECLSSSIGKMFEPYVIEVLPILLKSLGDPVPEVREAADGAAKQIMKNTTSFGVKKLIPLAISNLDEIAWRSKKGSVELLGSMAYLDPTQLSASLSSIVPEIVGVLNDTHKEVRKAADQALKRFGEVIRNPEIQAIVPDLLNAIGDPTKYTEESLDKLIKTQFVHYIDGPSLALIIHVIHRGMRDRSAATKKKACQIVGNMAILVDAKDLRPYLSQLVSELEVAMVDPVPATRSTAARALGSLVEKLGEELFPDLIPRLLDTLQDESKAGDRLGSAQALAEVICGLGINKLEDLLPSILSSAVSTRNHIRAGYMPLLLFLPVCFGSQFSPYLNRIIPPILNGLADVDEDIRDTALRAGRLIVKNYAKKAVDLLLPELELGLSDSSYRIRLSSLELTGDLLFQITGISGKNELSEDQPDFTGEVNKSLVEVLGQERRDRILASLFVCRSDVNGMVRSSAVDIWKALVANTPRTVKEIIPSLTSIIIRRLASDDDVQKTIAAQTLGDMVRLVGSNALSQLLPTLEDNLNASDDGAKQGICIALNELIVSSQVSALTEFQDVFIRIIRDALVDSSAGVREAAAQAFESLQEELGKVVIDEILPYLLNMLESDDSENALLALQDIMAAKADVIFPILIPSLLSPPIDSFKAKALSSLASVAGSALYRRLGLIINTLVNVVISVKSGPEEELEEINSAFDTILLAIDDDEGVHPLMQQILSLIKHEDSKKRAVMYERLGNFFTHTSIDYSVYLQDMLSQFILSLDDKTPEVVQSTFDALTALIKRQPKETLDRLVKPAYQALDITGVAGQDLAAFALPRGPNCILPIFLHGLMYGSSDQKELSALAIADIIDKTPALNLKPFATTITGPLIRVIGEKVSSNIKAAILVALNNLLVKIPQFLRPFIPQLQRTFVRSLSDVTNDTLRARAVVALGTLIEFQPRVDSLVTELVTGAKNSDDQGVKTSMLKGMLEVVDKAGNNMNEASKTSIMTLVEDEITLVDDKSAVSYARLIGSLAKIMSADEATNIIRAKILEKPGNSNDKFCILSVNSFLRYSPSHIFNTGLVDDIVAFVVACSDSPIPYISENATVAIGKIMLLVGEVKSPVIKDNAKSAASSPTPYEISQESLEKLVLQIATTALKPVSNSADVRRLSLVVLRTVARFKFSEVIEDHLDILVPSVFSCLRDSLIPVKLAAEKLYLALFNLVEDVEMKKFTEWFAGKEEITTVLGATIVPRSIGDYTRRVAVRLAGVERERIEAGGDEETMFSDRFEDEDEVWAVGSVEIASK